MDIHQVATGLISILCFIIGYMCKKTYELTIKNRENTIRHNERIKVVEEWRASSTELTQAMAKDISKINEHLARIESMFTQITGITHPTQKK